MGANVHSLPSWLSGSKPRKAINIILVVVLLYSLIQYCGSDEPNHASKSSLANKNQARNRRIAAYEKARTLDRQYRLNHLSPKKISAARSTELYGDKASSNASKYTATIVLGRRLNETERVAWLDELQNIQKREVYIVDNTETDLPHLEKNHGREGAVYLTYIIKNYDKLNDITFFWHTDKIVWHNNLLLQWDSVLTINRMDRENIMRQGYVPSRCDHWPGCPAWIRFNPSKAEHSMDPHKLEEMFDPSFFKQIFPDIPVDDFPPYFAGTCCSQFALSRDTIRGRPIETYKRLLSWVLEYQSDSRSGTVLEYLWPYLFTRRGTACPSMQECYCKTYNFCVENQWELEQINNWNSLRTRREEVKWQVTFMENAMETKKAAMQRKGASSEDIEKAVGTAQQELDRLVEELKKLEQNTWQKREDIIHHWGLPPPPVGW